MKVSYKWLQNYFDQPLPSPKELADILTFSVFEIESIESVGEDIVLDVKVLPDRARYALCHKGIAYEIGAILHRTLKDYPQIIEPTAASVPVHIDDTDACPRYMLRKIEGITMAPSPEWLKGSLEVLGQKSINSLVDAANLTLLDLGQPLHIFDADKVQGIITVRYAKDGEKITTLDKKEIALDPSILVIADDNGPLAIAGIKGGIRAEVDNKTQNILIESANFNAALIRKTSTKIGIRTDASKRYENEISPDLVADGMLKVTALIKTINSPATISEVTDIYSHPIKPWQVIVSAEFISQKLGIPIEEKTISDILSRLLLIHELSQGVFIITIPTWRGDLTIKEDIVEEIGRIYGYDKLPAAVLSATTFVPHVHKEFYYQNKIRDILVQEGFSEAITYAFQPQGTVEMEKPLAADKKYLRENLTRGISQSLELNTRNADLLGLDQVKIFEIGKIFSGGRESLSLAVAIKNIKKSKKKEGDELRDVIEKLGFSLEKFTSDTNSIEVDLDSYISIQQSPERYDEVNSQSDIKIYTPFSIYPFSVRDIAVFTPEGTQEEDVRKIIEKEAGTLLVKNKLFDVFTKNIDGVNNTSYAFRMVFQSFEKTLTEEEINSIMSAITLAMNAKDGWKVR